MTFRTFSSLYYYGEGSIRTVPFEMQKQYTHLYIYKDISAYL